MLKILLSRYIVCKPLYTMTQLTEKINIKKINEENDRLVMKSLGVDYEKFRAQGHQCEQ